MVKGVVRCTKMVRNMAALKSVCVTPQSVVARAKSALLAALTHADPRVQEALKTFFYFFAKKLTKT